MTEASKIDLVGLQKIDCNCNDCKLMVRDMVKFNESLERHKKWQMDYFEGLKNKMVEKAKQWLEQGDQGKHDSVMKEAGRMKFQFDKSECSINYGTCSKFSKPVSFIPNTCQIETQSCFEHRRA